MYVFVCVEIDGGVCVRRICVCVLNGVRMAFWYVFVCVEIGRGGCVKSICVCVLNEQRRFCMCFCLLK